MGLRVVLQNPPPQAHTGRYQPANSKTALHLLFMYLHRHGLQQNLLTMHQNQLIFYEGEVCGFTWLGGEAQEARPISKGHVRWQEAALVLKERDQARQLLTHLLSLHGTPRARK